MLSSTDPIFSFFLLLFSFVRRRRSIPRNDDMYAASCKCGHKFRDSFMEGGDIGFPRGKTARMRALNEIATPPPPCERDRQEERVCRRDWWTSNYITGSPRAKPDVQSGIHSAEHRAVRRDSKDADAKRFLVDTLCIICATGPRPVRRPFGWLILGLENSGSRKLGDWKFFVSLEIVEWNGFDDDFFVTEMDRLR